VGALVATFAAAQFVAAPVLGGLSDRFGRKPIVVLSMLGSSANYLLLAWAPSLAWLFIGRLISGATAASASAANAYIADITPPELRSSRFRVRAAFGGMARARAKGALDRRQTQARRHQPGG
jgi:DHA1 family tetracycline resistance protein-like MFS transporter